MQDTQAISNGVPIELGGTTYLLRPVTVGELGSFKATAIERTWEEATRRIKHLEAMGIASPENRKEVFDWAVQRIDTGRAQGEYASDPEGTAHLIWLAIDQKLPLDNVREALRFADLEAVQAKIDRTSFPNSKTPSTKEQSPGTTTELPPSDLLEVSDLTPRATGAASAGSSESGTVTGPGKSSN